jgi:hypothetical protein
VAIVQEGALPSLIALLCSTDERIQERAAVSLRNRNVYPQNEIQIVQDGGLRPFSALLRSAHEKVVRQAAGALANFTTVNPKNKIKLVQACMVLAHWLHCSSTLTTRFFINTVTVSHIWACRSRSMPLERYGKATSRARVVGLLSSTACTIPSQKFKFRPQFQFTTSASLQAAKSLLWRTRSTPGVLQARQVG